MCDDDPADEDPEGDPADEDAEGRPGQRDPVTTRPTRTPRAHPADEEPEGDPADEDPVDDDPADEDPVDDDLTFQNLAQEAANDNLLLEAAEHATFVRTSPVF